MMTEREWVEITVYFNDNWVHVIKRKNLRATLDDELGKDVIRAVKDVSQGLHQVEWEAEG